MQLAGVAALTPNNKPLALHSEPQKPRSVSIYKNHSEYSQYQEYLASLTEDSTQILQNRVFTQPGHGAVS